MAFVLDFFTRHLVNPILPPKEVAQAEHPEIPYFVLNIRAISIAVAFFIGVPPMFNGMIVVLLRDPGQLAGILVVLLGCLLYFSLFSPPYLWARFYFRYPAGILCDSVALGMLTGCICWDIASPTFVPMGFGGLFIAAFVGWCASPRGPLIIGLVAAFMMFQMYNTIAWRNNLRDEGIHYKDQAFVYYNALRATHTMVSATNASATNVAALAAQILPVVAAGGAAQDRWNSPYPFHLYPSAYYFPHIVVDVLVGFTLVFIVVLVYFAMQVQAKELTRQSAAARSAVEIVETIADALRKYNTAAAHAVLARAQGMPGGAESHRRRSMYDDDASASLNASRSIPHDEASVGSPPVPSTNVSSSASTEPALSRELAASLDALVANLDAYRPYLPNWLLHSDESTEADGVADDGSPRVVPAALEEPPMRAAGGSQCSSNHSASTASRHSATGGRRLSRRRAGNLSPTGFRHVAATRATCAFAIVTFDPRRSDNVSTQESLTAFIDLLHVAAHETKGAVHSFVLGEATVSWNCAMACANPESKAAFFTARLRDAAEGRRMADSLDLVWCSVAVVTGTARCETAGTEQRAVTSLGPCLASRLRGLSAFARAAAADLGFAGICDAATAAGASSHYIIGPVGVVNTAAFVAPAPPDTLACPIGSPGHGRWAHMLLPPPSSPVAAAPSTCASLAPAFEVIGGRGDHGDEWLYAMVDGPSEIAAKAVVAAADTFTHIVAPDHRTPGSGTYTAEVESQAPVSPLVCHSQAEGSVSSLPQMPATLHTPRASTRHSCPMCRSYETLLQGLRHGAPRTTTALAVQLLDRAAMAEPDGPVLSQRPMWQAWRASLASALNDV